MSLEQVKQYFDSLGLGQRVHELAQSSATVEEAAVAVGWNRSVLLKPCPSCWGRNQY